MTATIDLAGHIERSYTREVRTYQGMSGAGDCIRTAWFRKNHPELEAKPDAAGIVTLEDGHLHEGDVVKILWQTVVIDLLHTGVNSWHGVDRKPEEQFQIIGDGELRGHIDGLVKVDGKWHILECKAKGTNSWARLAKAGSVREGAWQNYCQAQLYLHFRQSLADELGITIEPTLLYIAKNKDPQRDPAKRVGNGVYYEEWIELNPSDVNLILAFEKSKAMAMDDANPPAPIYLDGQYIRYHEPTRADERGGKDALCRAIYCGMRDACLNWRPA